MERVDIVDMVKRTFEFMKTYVNLKCQRTVSVAPSTHPYNCAIKKQSDDLDHKLKEKISKLEKLARLLPLVQ